MIVSYPRPSAGHAQRTSNLFDNGSSELPLEISTQTISWLAGFGQILSSTIVEPHGKDGSSTIINASEGSLFPSHAYESPDPVSTSLPAALRKNLGFTDHECLRPGEISLKWIPSPTRTTIAYFMWRTLRQALPPISIRHYYI